MTGTIRAALAPDLSVKNFTDLQQMTSKTLQPPTTRQNRAMNEPSCSQFVCMWSADQRAKTPSVVHQQLFLINPGDPGLLAASPQHVLLCLHTLISLVSVQNVPRNGDLWINVPLSPILYLLIPLSQKPEILLESVREIRGSESAYSWTNTLS